MHMAKPEPPLSSLWRFYDPQEKNYTFGWELFGRDSSDLKWVILHHYELEVKIQKAWPFYK